MLIKNKKFIRFNKDNPFLAKIIQRKRLTSINSKKEIIHFVLDIGKSCIEYRPGDSLGIYPMNNPKHVDFIISLRLLTNA